MYVMHTYPDSLEYVGMFSSGNVICIQPMLAVHPGLAAVTGELDIVPSYSIVC